MHLGVRVFFGFFLVTGLAAYFVLTLFVKEIKPSVRQVMEDLMIDTANVLAELASNDLAAPDFSKTEFAQQVSYYAQRQMPADTRIWGVPKQSLDFRVYVISKEGTVIFDSYGTAQGKDFSQWRDVYLTLRGKYGARATREVEGDAASSVLHIAAPIMRSGDIAGVLTVAKPVASIQAFVDKAEAKMFTQAAWLLGLSAAVGVGVTLWIVFNIRRLRRYANAVQTDAKPPVPNLKGELGELAQAMEAMRRRLAAKDYIEAYVQALAHELKSPLTALHGSAELLQTPLSTSDTQRFAAQVLAQSERVQQLLKQLLELSKLETQSGLQTKPANLAQTAQSVAQQWFDKNAPSQTLAFEVSNFTAQRSFDPALIALALETILHNAASFAPPQSVITVGADAQCIWVRDQGAGLPAFALTKLQNEQRFFATPRPDGTGKGSGLGLAIAAQIMRLHGGRVVFENQIVHDAGGEKITGLKVTLRFA